MENATNSDKAITVRRETSVVERERKPHRGQCSTRILTWSTALGVAGDAQAQNCGRGQGMRGLAARRTVDPKALTAADVLLLEEGHCLREQALEICGAAGAASEELMATSLETLAHMVRVASVARCFPPSPRGQAVCAAQPGSRSAKRLAPHRTIGLVWRRRYPHGDTLHDMARCLRQGLPADVSAARSASTISRRPLRSPS